MTNIFPIIVIFINIFLAFFVLCQSLNSASNRIFALMATLGAFWTFANFMTDKFSSIFWLQTTYAIGSLLITIGLIWVLLITQNSLKTWPVIPISFISLLFFIASYQNGFIVRSIEISHSSISFSVIPGWGLALYAIFYFTSAFLILFKLFLSIRKIDNAEKNIQFKYVLTGASITLITTFCTSFVFPDYFSFFLSSSIDSIGFLIFLFFIAYSITKHRLFNIRIITIEIVTFALWIIMLLRIIISDNRQEVIVYSGVLIITIIFGTILIRSVLNEMQQREYIEKLTKDLQKIYSQEKFTSPPQTNPSSPPPFP